MEALYNLLLDTINLRNVELNKGCLMGQSRHLGQGRLLLVGLMLVAFSSLSP
jgi:hypothetical protein